MELNELFPPLKRTQPVDAPLPTYNALKHRKHYREHTKKICYEKLLEDIAKRGRVPNPQTLVKLEADKEEILIAWLAFKKTGQAITSQKNRKMKLMLQGWL